MTVAAWEQQIKVGVGIALSHPGPALNAHHLFEMEMPKPYGLVFNRAYGVDMARNNIVIDAINHDATHIVWLDEDVFPPKDGIMRLLRHNHEKTIISGIYYDKKPGVKNPAAWKKDKEGNYCVVIDPKIYEDGVNEDGTQRVFLSDVDAIGMGFCVTPVELFKKLERPWFWYGLSRDGHLDKNDKRAKVMSEDFYLCNRAYEIGWKVMVDWSIRCDHLTYAFINGKDGSMEIARV